MSRVQAMVSKCANPECTVAFQYFREGKLFRIEAQRVTTARPTLISGKRAQHVEHYWLCGACSAKFTLAHDPNKGAVVVPLAHSVRRAAAS